MRQEHQSKPRADNVSQRIISKLDSLKDILEQVELKFGGWKNFAANLQNQQDLEVATNLSELADKFESILPEAEEVLSKVIREAQLAEIKLPETDIKKQHILYSRQPEPVNLDSVLVVTKISKIEFYRRLHGLSIEQAFKNLQAEQGDISVLVNAHMQLEQAKKSLLQYFAKDQIIDCSELDDDKLKSASAVISLGGDDHFCQVSQRVQGRLPIIGLKADQHSVGALLNYDFDKLAQLVLDLDSANYSFEAWTRLKVTVNGKQLAPALSTIFIGDSHSQLTSRTVLKIKDSEGNFLHDSADKGIEHRSSGVLIYTGTGSTGWASSASLYLYPQGHTFKRSARYAEFLLREPTVESLAKANSGKDSKLTLPKASHFVLHEGEKIIIKSLNKDSGIINADSECVAFARGAEAVIEIDPQPLWVITGRKNNMKTGLTYSDPNLGIVSRTQKDASYPERLLPESSKFSWHVEAPEYSPQYFEHPKLLKAEWAEARLSKDELLDKYNQGLLKSFAGELKLDRATGMPLNPVGRTGICGRGVLGKYGANFAVDPVVICKDPLSLKYSVLVIERKDGGVALPGGMVDEGESVQDALFRELEEETSASKEQLKDYLLNDWGLDIYADDRRSTDNAWIETSARLIYIPKQLADSLILKAGSDACNYRWLELNEQNLQQLYGAHAYIVKQAQDFLEKEHN